jgi:hypothetical protein
LSLIRQRTLGLGKSSKRMMPSVESGRYAPGPGMVYHLVEVYQVIRTLLPIRSPIRPGNPALDSPSVGVLTITRRMSTRGHRGSLAVAWNAMARRFDPPLRIRCLLPESLQENRIEREEPGRKCSDFVFDSPYQAVMIR